jgi:hypothetical protein
MKNLKQNLVKVALILLLFGAMFTMFITFESVDVEGGDIKYSPLFEKDIENYDVNSFGLVKDGSIYVKNRIWGIRSAFYYKFSDGKWEWSPDKINWMSTSTFTVTNGDYHGQNPARTNIDIIKSLEQKRKYLLKLREDYEKQNYDPSILDEITIIQTPISPPFTNLSSSSVKLELSTLSKTILSSNNLIIVWSVLSPCEKIVDNNDHIYLNIKKSSLSSSQEIKCEVQFVMRFNENYISKKHIVTFTNSETSSVELPPAETGPSQSPTIQGQLFSEGDKHQIKFGDKTYTFTIKSFNDQNVVVSYNPDVTINKGNTVSITLLEGIVTIIYHGTVGDKADLTISSSYRVLGQDNCIIFQYKCENNVLFKCNSSLDWELKKVCDNNLKCNTDVGDCLSDSYPNCNEKVLDALTTCHCTEGPNKGEDVNKKNLCVGFCKDCYGKYENCLCKPECQETGPIESGQTCGGINTSQSCRTQGGQCMTQEKCDVFIDNQKKINVSFNYQPFNSNFECLENNVCCNIKTSNDREHLYDCAKICNTPQGCSCPKSCLQYAGSKLNENLQVLPGFNCLGFYQDDPARVSICNNNIKDGICPKGCFWWNDLDCGRDSNIISLLWDIAPSHWFRDDYYNHEFVKAVNSFGMMFDIRNWAESLCNPVNRGKIQPDQDGYFFNADSVGWISGLRQGYNETHLVYSMSYYLSGLKESNQYRIELKGNNIKFNYPHNNTINATKHDNNFWFNISSFETKQESKISLIDTRVFNKICIIFKNETRLDDNFVSQKFQEVCRSLNDIWD